MSEDETTPPRSVTPATGSRSSPPSMNAVGQLMAVLIGLFLLPLFPVYLVYRVARLFRAR